MNRIALAFAICAAATLSGCGIAYSDGARAGVPQKISHKGLLCRTYEGELVMDGIRVKSTENGAGITNVWKFSVANASVAEQIDKAAEAGARVKLHYTEKLLPNICEQATTYLVTKVEAADAAAAK